MRKFICLFVLTTLVILKLGTLCADPFAVYLTWQNDPTSSITINWICKNKSALPFIFFKEASSPEWGRVKVESEPFPQNGPYQLFIHEFSQLKPDTVYQFHFSDDKQILKFQTMPKTLKKQVCFIVGGDTNHEGTHTFKEMNRVAASRSPSFVIFGGDLAYACKKNPEKEEDIDKWLEWIEAYSKTMVTKDGRLIPLVVAIGNHDVSGAFGRSPKEAAVFYRLFRNSARSGYESLRFGTYLSLYILDTNHTSRVGGKQKEWLRHELKKDGKMLNRFAVYHVPAYPTKSKTTSKPTKTIRKHWVPLFDEYSLHVAFEHHDHSYKRTYRLKNNEVHSEGVLYIGDGAWGAQPKNKGCALPDYIEKHLPKSHFLEVTLSEEERQILAIDRENRVIDKCVHKVKK